MITKIEALNYRALRYVSQTLSPFQVLIGPNASGKSTFLDVIAFIADILNKPSLSDAVRDRAPSFHNLTWMNASDWLELAIETDIPERFLSNYQRIRYEIRLGIDDATNELALLTESLWFLTTPTPIKKKVAQLFPVLLDIPDRITRERQQHTPAGWRKIVSKIDKGNDYFKSEKTEWNNNFRLGPKRPALANLPEDEERFPISIWFKRYISEGVQRIMLNSEALRRPSPPLSPRTFLPDGSNLPWVIFELETKAPERFKEWLQHVRTALPDIENISTNERSEDRHRYLVIEYKTGLQAPSWVVSDGTLRLLALTILAYIPDLTGIYLIEEPENGIHPRAVETVFQSLSNVYDAQIFLATHSPIILSMTEQEQLLCFARTEAGETAIVQGDSHPRLQEWRGEVSLATLFAGGVLG